MSESLFLLAWLRSAGKQWQAASYFTWTVYEKWAQRRDLEDESQEDQESHGAEQEDAAAGRGVVGGPEEVDLDQDKKRQEAAGNESCPERQQEKEGINQNHTEHISMRKMFGILNIPVACRTA